MMKLKMIVAREGLIIISLLFISGFFLYLSHLQVSWKSKAKPKAIHSYVEKTQEINPQTIICEKGDKVQFEKNRLLKIYLKGV